MLSHGENEEQRGSFLRSANYFLSRNVVRKISFHYLQVFPPARYYNLMMMMMMMMMMMTMMMMTMTMMMTTMMIIIIVIIVIYIIFLIVSILRWSIYHHHLLQKCNITASFKGEWLQKTGVEVTAQPGDT